MNALLNAKKLPTDEWISELVRLYSVALGGSSSKEAAAAAEGFEKAAMLAAGAEASMIQSVVAERLAYARIKSLGLE